MIAWGFFVGALWVWFGWLSVHDLSHLPFKGFSVARLSLLLLILVAAIDDTRRFRFPFIKALTLFFGWLFVTDLISGGGSWSAVVTLVVGLAYAIAGGSSERPTAFWQHLFGGLLIGGSLLYWWHGGDWQWALICVVALVYVGMAHRTRPLELGRARRDRPPRRVVALLERVGERREQRVVRAVRRDPVSAAGCRRSSTRSPASCSSRSASWSRGGDPASGLYNPFVEKPLRIGVLAVQGNFREHAAVLRRLGAEPVEVRLPAQLDGLDGLILPGGESTAITRLMRLYGIDEALRSFDAPIFGTCAGMIILDRDHLALADIRVERNAFGRQVKSFEADIDIGHGDEPVRAVFIRAPWIAEAGAGRRRSRRGRRASGARAAGPDPRRGVPSGADRRHADPRALPEHGAGGDECPGIASGRRSSTRRAPPTRSAASSSRS